MSHLLRSLHYLFLSLLHAIYLHFMDEYKSSPYHSIFRPSYSGISGDRYSVYGLSSPASSHTVSSSLQLICSLHDNHKGLSLRAGLIPAIDLLAPRQPQGIVATCWPHSCN